RPGEHERHRFGDVLPLARTRSGSDGRFTLSARLDLDDYFQLLVTGVTSGAGLAGRKYKAADEPLELTLAPEVKLEGRLRTPEGTPARGVRVEVLSLEGLQPGPTNWHWYPSAPAQSDNT